MRFVLLDRVVQIEPARLIRTEKKLTLAEEYLADHFPGFPVMPGVLILEAMVQSSAWLMRVQHDFEYSTILLKETKAVRYKGFVSPGQTLSIESQVHQTSGQDYTFKCEGFIDGKSCCNARIVMTQFNLAEKRSGAEAIDASLRRHFRSLWQVLAPKEPQLMA